MVPANNKAERAMKEVYVTYCASIQRQCSEETAVIFASLLSIHLVAISMFSEREPHGHKLGGIAGFFLFAVQPFKLGDRISVSYTSPAAASSASRSAWFEGTCEKVDLRYVKKY